jgi:hypothetical protein
MPAVAHRNSVRGAALAQNGWRARAKRMARSRKTDGALARVPGMAVRTMRFDGPMESLRNSLRSASQP